MAWLLMGYLSLSFVCFSNGRWVAHARSGRARASGVETAIVQQPLAALCTQFTGTAIGSTGTLRHQR